MLHFDVSRDNTHKTIRTAFSKMQSSINSVCVENSLENQAQTKLNEVHS